MPFLFGHACPRIFNGKFQHAVVVVHCQGYTAVLRELDGIGKKVVADLQDTFLIGQDNRIRVVVHGKGQSLVHGNGHELCFKNVCDIGNPAWGNVGLFLAVVQTEEVQQCVEHPAHTVGRLPYVPNIHPGFIRIMFFVHQSGIAGYRRQRRAKFMGDGMDGFLAGENQCLVLLYRLLQPSD